MQQTRGSDAASVEGLNLLGNELQLSRDAQTILDSSFDGFLVTDGQGVVLWVNPASAQICGVSRDELIGKSVKDLENKGVFNPSVTRQVLEERRTITFYQDTGSGRKVLVTGTPVFSEDNQIVHVVCNSRDITELLNLREQLEQAQKKAKRFQSELEALRENSLGLPKDLIIESGEMRKLVSTALRIAPKDVAILILGDSGVGKNAFAKAIHDASQRSSFPFIEINCGAIPENLVESELFGYESGAFTGARKEGKHGLIELADHGTLFLNEIGELPLSMQVKLLTVLQEGQFTRVGGTRQITANVRVIAATNRNIEQMIVEGKFREDLYYRLNVVTLTIPPLRERLEDVIIQAEYFLTQFNEKYGIIKKFSPPAVQELLHYHWPGNTRELKNAIERAVVMSNTPLIEPGDLQLKKKDNHHIPPLKKALEEVEKELLVRALKVHKSTHKVAKILGISQPTVVRRSKKYHLNTYFDEN